MPVTLVMLTIVSYISIKTLQRSVLKNGGRGQGRGGTWVLNEHQRPSAVCCFVYGEESQCILHTLKIPPSKWKCQISS